MRISEENFINYIKKKDEKALDFVIATYGGLIKSIVKKHLYNLEQLQGECIDDVLLSIWYQIDNFNAEKSSFTNWLGCITKYKCIDYKRKYLRRLEAENIEDIKVESELNVEKEVLKNDLSYDVQSLLDTLKDADKDLFIKHYVEEKEISDLSAEMGIKTSVLYNRLSRGKSKLRAAFNSFVDDWR